MWYLKKNTKELIYKTEIDSHTYTGNKHTYIEKKLMEGGRDKLGILDKQIYTTIYKINNKDLLYSIGNYIQI